MKPEVVPSELKWLEILRQKTWITEEEDEEKSVQELAEAFNNNIESALDEKAPYNHIKVFFHL